MKPESAAIAIYAIKKILNEPNNHCNLSKFEKELRETVRFLEKYLDDYVNGGRDE